MQYPPGRLIATQSQYPLQTQGTDTVFLSGHVPYRGKPAAQWGARLGEHRPRGDRPLVAAVATHQPGTLRSVGLVLLAAAGALEARRPPQALEVTQARRLVREPVQELVPVLGVVATSDRAR